MLRHVFVGCLVALVGFMVVAVRAAETGDHAARLDAWLERAAKDYNPDLKMIGKTWHGPGYHSTVPAGTWVHPTRDNMLYAIGLVQRGLPADLKRAAGVIRAVLKHQDTNSENKTYGIWPWLAEEPLTKMAPPDWNWADFIGASLAEMLKRYPDRLPDDLEQEMQAALGHAAAAIKKRNVGPGYTNIAIMGGVVTTVAGELLGDSELLEYGRDRLIRCVKHAEYHGNFTEYNSPTYTVVALKEAERGTRLIEDDKARAAAEQLRQIAWRTIADSFHPATKQWAGPHARVYSDCLSDKTLQALADRTGLDLVSGDPPVMLVEAVPPQCPEKYLSRMKQLPESPLELERVFIRQKDPKWSTVGTTWFSEAATLGSVNRAGTWVQRRPILGYWKLDGAAPAVFRVRWLHDGKDFASGRLTTEQDGSRLLTVLSAHGRRGDWHHHLDHPKDHTFSIDDLRLRFQVEGRGAKLRKLADDRYELSAGDHRIVVHTAAGQFRDASIRWEAGQEGDVVFVDAICYSGETQRMNFRKVGPVVLGAAVELLKSGDVASTEAVDVQASDGGNVQADWAGLSVQAPMRIE